MAIVIARTGDLLPVSAGADPDRKASVWALIVQAWAENNQEKFCSMLDQPIADRAGE